MPYMSDIGLKVLLTIILNNRIAIFSTKSGACWNSFDLGGTTARLKKPVDVAWDSQCHLLVLDRGSLKVVARNGTFLRAVDVTGSFSCLTVVGDEVMLSDVYSVSKFRWTV